MVVFLVLSVGIIQITPAHAVPVSLVSAKYTEPKEITIVFSGPLDWVIGDFTNISHDFIGGSPTVVLIAESAPSSTVTITFSGTDTFPDETGTIDIASISAGGSGNTFAGSASQAIIDGQFPAFSSIVETVTKTTVNVNFTEPIGGTFSASNFAVLGFFVTGISPSGAQTGVPFVTLTLSTQMAADETPIVEYTPGDLADPTGNLMPSQSVVADDGINPSITEAFVFFPGSVSFNLDESIVNNGILASDFTVSGIASNPDVSFVGASGTAVTLTLNDSILTSDTSILLSYVKDTGSLNDSSGHMLQSFSNLAVTNAAPLMTFAATTATTTINVFFDTDLDGATVDASDFTVAENTVTGAIEGDGVVTLTLGTPIGTGATPLVSLVAPVTDVDWIYSIYWKYYPS